MELIKNEKIVQCLSREINDKFYFPTYAVSNLGRIWSIKREKWLQPSCTGERYFVYHLTNNLGAIRKVKVHQIVNYYFPSESDQILLKHYDREDLEVHHDKSCVIPDSLKSQGRGNEEVNKKIRELNMKFNSATNLFLQVKEDHKNETTLSHGWIPESELNGTLILGEEAQFMRTQMKNNNPSNGIKIEYYEDENGQLRRNLNMTVHFKGSGDLEKENQK